MAKITGGLLSFGASGTLSKTVTFSKWRGTPYARTRVVPANPQSTNQTKTRSVFSWLMAAWKLMSPDAQAPWTAFAQGKPLTDRNAFNKTNIPLLRTPVVLTTLVGSPGAKGGLAHGGMTLTPGAGTIDAAIAAPTLPTGWTISSAVAVAFQQQDPHVDTMYESQTATDVTAPYSCAFTGLAAGDWVVSGWLVYTKPDGSTAYGPSTSAVTTVT